MVVFLVNLIWSMLIKREPLEGNPWASKSLEWQLPTPVPIHDFDRFPRFEGDPYPYGVEPGLEPAGGAALTPAGGD
jgi:cytochrome c oxidase subunit 1